MKSMVYNALTGLSVLFFLITSAQAKTWTKEEILAHFRPAESASEQTPEEVGSANAALNQDRTRSWGATRGIALQSQSISKTPALKPTVMRSLDMEVKFDFASHQLSIDSYSELQALAAALQQLTHQGQRFAIIGHTDGVGGEEENQALSTLRASAVFNYLTTRMHIKPDMLYVQGKGESELKRPTSPDSAENRRVEILELPAHF